MMYRFVELRWTLLAAVISGVLVAPIGQTWWHSLLSYYDDAKPVISLYAAVLQRGPDSLVLHLTAQKHRDCRYIRFQAFMQLPNGEMDDIGLLRVDQPEEGRTKPVGKLDLGEWKVWPVNFNRPLLIYGQYWCGDRLVTSKALEFDLRQIENK